ncbi:MAG: hypothetical protein IIZ80_05345, partial [Erysipelotrichaceae bacterium]|nr:hypothetical protein [Erysipelotrichaceae bacterium]
MKRIRIWLSNFTLIQQFLAIVFFTGAVLLFFIFTYLNRNIDSFVNLQMYEFIHRAQNEYLETRTNHDDSNVIHYVYSIRSGKYLNSVSNDIRPILEMIDPDPEGGQIDSSFSFGDN